MKKNPTIGSTQMLLLKLLSQKDMYGYEIIDVLRRRSENVFEMKAGTLYPLLHGLQQEGYLTSYEKEVMGRVRICYHITDEGVRYLNIQVTEWERYSRAIHHVLSWE